MNDAEGLKAMNEMLAKFSYHVDSKALDRQEQIFMDEYGPVGLERPTARALGGVLLIEDAETKRLMKEGYNRKEAVKKFRQENLVPVWAFYEKWRSLMDAKKKAKMLKEKLECMEAYHEYRNKHPAMDLSAVVNKIEQERSDVKERIEHVQHWRRRR